MPGLPLFAGGKSFGGRMTSQTQADRAMHPLRGLIFLGFPLHAARKPSASRADHLAQIHIPMLFLQGTRDALADLALLKPLVERLGSTATMTIVPDADHAFHVPKRAGRTDADVMASMLDALSAWITRH